MTKNKEKFQYSLDNSYQTEKVEIARYNPRINSAQTTTSKVGRDYYFNIATP